MFSSSLSNSTFLITGASGMLGRALVDHFSAEPSNLILAMRFSTGLSTSRSNVREISADLRKPAELWLDALGGCVPDYVIHAAALTSIEVCEGDFMAAVQANAIATSEISRLVQRRRWNSKIVYISTDAIYPDSDCAKNELVGPAPATNYGISKLWGEEVLRFTYKNHLIIRTTVVGLKSSQFVSWMISTARKGKSVGLFYDVMFTPIFVSDFALVLETALLENLGGVYNLGCREPITKLDFGKRIIQRLEIDSDIAEISLRSILNGGGRSYNMSLCSKALENKLGPLPSAADTIDSIVMAIRGADVIEKGG